LQTCVRSVAFTFGTGGMQKKKFLVSEPRLILVLPGRALPHAPETSRVRLPPVVTLSDERPRGVRGFAGGGRPRRGTYEWSI